MKIFFMRHAHSLSQMDKSVVVGRAAEKPLSQKGILQAERFARYANTLGIERIFSSTCIRAIQTAEAVSKATGLNIQPDKRLIERSHGDLEGKLKTEVYTPGLVRIIHSDQLNWRPLNGESLEDVKSRLNSFLSDLSNLEQSPPVLVVTHLMVLWALFHMCTQCNHAILPKLYVDNTGLVEIDADSGRSLQVIRWNHSVTPS